MNKEHHIMADPLKFSAALFTVAVCMFLAWRGFQQGYAFWSVIFVIIALVFFYIMYLYGSVLKINKDGVQKSFLFIPLNFLRWDQIKEIGVVGTKIFNGNSQKKKTGRRYIYISPEELDEGTRFKMALEWPPRREIMYCIYTHQHIDAIQYLWGKPIAKYNAGNIFVDLDE